ncbi:MAG: substrate-binding domain-containing protein [Treponema sp.]|nr:substrate-binding domain-containing protein [Treponema sp.]
MGFTACNQGGTVSNETRQEELYSMVVFSKGSEYFNWCYAGFIAAAEAIGPHIRTELVGAAEVDAAMEVKALEQLIAKKPNGVVVTSADSATLVPSINEAVRAGIPVVGFDVDSPDSDRLGFVGTDNTDFGRVAADIAAKLANGSGEVAILYVPGNVDLEKRLNGFKARCAERYPNLKVVLELNHEGEVVKAESVTTSLLQANPGIDVIFVSEGLGCSGVAAAIRSLGMGDRVKVIASDFNTATNDLMKAGEVAATVVDDPYFIGWDAFLQIWSAAHPTNRASLSPPFGYVAPGIYCEVAPLYPENLADASILAKYLNPPNF